MHVAVTTHAHVVPGPQSSPWLVSSLLCAAAALAWHVLRHMFLQRLGAVAASAPPRFGYERTRQPPPASRTASAILRRSPPGPEMARGCSATAPAHPAVVFPRCRCRRPLFCACMLLCEGLLCQMPVWFTVIPELVYFAWGHSSAVVCLVLRFFVRPGAASCAYSCFAHVRPWALWPMPAWVWRDVRVFFFHFFDLSLKHAMHGYLEVVA